MFIETHILQNFAPSNLNRDDTGAPKECMFGGARRARISSQCVKRAMRTGLSDSLGDEDLAVRTKYLASQLAQRLAARGRAEEDATQVARAALASSGISADSKSSMTSYLLLLGRRELDDLAEICEDNWDALLEAADQAGPDKAPKAVEKVGQGMHDVLVAAGRNGSRAVDLALFGRMVADAPEAGVDACCQVAHAISTHRVAVEFDFYTAVDDLRPEDTHAAGMMGTVEFNSACYYRYANVSTDALSETLGDRERVRHALGAWLDAGIDAVPTGKQNSMAAWNRPSLILAVLRDSQPCSLANAFVPPVSADRESDGDLIGASVRALDEHWGKLRDMYGEDGVRGIWVATTHASHLRRLAGEVCTRTELVNGAGTAALDALESLTAR